MKVTMTRGCESCKHKDVCKYIHETKIVYKSMQTDAEKIETEHLTLNVMCKKYLLNTIDWINAEYKGEAKCD